MNNISDSFIFFVQPYGQTGKSDIDTPFSVKQSRIFTEKYVTLKVLWTIVRSDTKDCRRKKRWDRFRCYGSTIGSYISQGLPGALNYSCHYICEGNFVCEVFSKPHGYNSRGKFEGGSFVPCARITGDCSENIHTPIKMYDQEGQETWSAGLDMYGRVCSFEGLYVLVLSVV